MIDPVSEYGLASSYRRMAEALRETQPEAAKVLEDEADWLEM